MLQRRRAREPGGRAATSQESAMSFSTTGPAWRRAALPASVALLVSAAVAAVVVGSGSSSVAATPDEPRTNTVTVAGTGMVNGTPDVLRLDIGVQRTGENVNAALNAANEDIRRIKDALGRHGVANKDIQTSQLSINPHYDPYYEGKGETPPVPAPMPAPDAPVAPPAPEPTSAPDVESGAAVDPAPPSASGGGVSSSDQGSAVAPEAKPMVDVAPAGPASVSAPRPGGGGINGYDVFQSLTVKLRDLDRAGDAISDAAEAGGNATRINGVSFDIEDNSELLERARDAAFADAKAKAEQYARLAGRSLGKVAQISENNYSTGPIAYGGARAEAAMDSSVPIQPGTQQVSISNTVVWELT
jgi:uncharacterized protein YggE